MRCARCWKARRVTAAPAGWDPNYGWGALDAAGALASMLGVPKPTPTPVPGLDAPDEPDRHGGIFERHQPRLD